MYAIEQTAFNEYVVSDGKEEYTNLTWMEAISLFIYLRLRRVT